MGMLSFLFHKKKPAAGRRAAAREGRSTHKPSSSRTAIHRELVSVALRDTLMRHGIPAGWIAVDMHSALNAKGEPLCHVRLVLKHWDSRLVEHAVAFQNSFSSRISLLDAKQSSWLRSISWQFAVPEDDVAPLMPPAATWRPAVAQVAPAAAVAAAAAAAPVRHAQLEQLRRLMAEGDALHGDDDGPADFQNTQPFEGMDADAAAAALAH